MGLHNFIKIVLLLRCLFIKRRQTLDKPPNVGKLSRDISVSRFLIFNLNVLETVMLIQATYFLQLDGFAYTTAKIANVLNHSVVNLVCMTIYWGGFIESLTSPS